MVNTSDQGVYHVQLFTTFPGGCRHTIYNKCLGTYAYSKSINQLRRIAAVGEVK